jgi:hypothetical protein
MTTSEFPSTKLPGLCGPASECLHCQIGYLFAAGTIVFLVLQKLSQFLWIRLRRT